MIVTMSKTCMIVFRGAGTNECKNNLSRDTRLKKLITVFVVRHRTHALILGLGSGSALVWTPFES